MVFTPYSTTFKAAKLLCICEQCQIKYGSCKIFQTYQFEYCLNKANLRCKTTDNIFDDSVDAANHDENSENVDDFIVAGTIVVVAADVKSEDTVWFLR